MKKIFSITALALFISFTSCKKDKAAPDPAPGTSGKRLVKLTKTEDNTTTVFNFVYDDKQRLSSYKSTDNKVGIIFTYDGNSNLVKVEDNEDGYKNVYTYAYNNNIPVSGTFKSWQKTAGEPDDLVEDDELTYTLSNNQVTKIHVVFKQTQDASDFALEYFGNGNLSKISNNSGYTASFGFGTKKPVFPVVSKYILDQAGFSLQFAAKNELTSFSFDFPGSQFDESITNQYTYDTNGYVLTSNDGASHAVLEYQ